MRFKIVPDDKIKLTIWHGRMCFEKSVPDLEKDFEQSEKGFEEMIHFLEQYYRSDEKLEPLPWENYKGWSKSYVENLEKNK